MPEAPFGHLSCHRTRALMGAKAIYQTVSEEEFSETEGTKREPGLLDPGLLPG